MSIGARRGGPVPRLGAPVRSARSRHDGGVQDAAGIQQHGGHEGDSLRRDYEDEGDEEEPSEHLGGVDAKGGGSRLNERLMNVVQPRRSYLAKQCRCE